MNELRKSWFNSIPCFIKSQLNNIIYTNIVVSISTFVLSAGFTFYLGIEEWLKYGVFAFFSTMAVYNGQRLFKSEQPNQTPWLDWVKRYQRLLFLVVIFCSIASLVSLLSILNWNIKTLFLLAVSGAISALYVIKIKGINMREIPYLKIHLIGISWSLILIVFPILNEDLNEPYAIYGLAYYLYVVAVTIPFDIRDLKHDKVEHKTIPQVLGVIKSKWIATLMLGAFVLLMAIVKTSFLYNPVFIMAVLVQLVLILLMNEKRSDVYCAGLIDGAIALLGISYFL